MKNKYVIATIEARTTSSRCLKEKINIKNILKHPVSQMGYQRIN